MKKLDLFKDAEVIESNQLNTVLGGIRVAISEHSDNGDSSHSDNGDSSHSDNGDSQHSDNGDSQHSDNGDSQHSDNMR